MARAEGRAGFRFKLVVSESLVSDFRIAISIYLMADYTCDVVNQWFQSNCGRFTFASLSILQNWELERQAAMA